MILNEERNTRKVSSVHTHKTMFVLHKETTTWRREGIKKIQIYNKKTFEKTWDNPLSRPTKKVKEKEKRS
mgnify:CR=1 FL=1